MMVCRSGRHSVGTSVACLSVAGTVEGDVGRAVGLQNVWHTGFEYAGLALQNEQVGCLVGSLYRVGRCFANGCIEGKADGGVLVGSVVRLNESTTIARWRL